MTIDFRARLLALDEELRARKARVDAHLRPVAEPVPVDAEDQFLQRQSDDVIQALAQRLEVEVEEVERALRRLDDGVYGRCERCAGAIGQARLVALPAAARCADCARLP